LGDDSDSASSPRKSEPSESDIPQSDSELELVDPEFMKDLNELISQFDTATHVPPIFAPLVRRLSNVVVMCLATGRLHGKDRNILFIGEVHSEKFRRKYGCTPISELIVPYLQNANYVDFMFEASVQEVNEFSTQKISQLTHNDMRSYQRQLEKPKNTTGIDIMNQLRQLLCWYIPTEGHPARSKFPRAKVHYLDHAYPTVHKKSNTLLHTLNEITNVDRHADTFRVQFDPMKRKIQSQLIELSHHMEDNLLTDALFFEAFDMSTTFEDRVYAQLLIFDCAFEELRRVVLKNCYAQERNINTLHYSSMFMTYSEKHNYDDFDFFYYLHRFLMDIYTCCRILKTDANERWYKNMVVYTGAYHTMNCIRLMELYGFDMKTVDVGDTPADTIPVPPFISGAIQAGEFRREGEEMRSGAIKGYLDSKGRFFEGPTPSYYELD
jgi:hypothetical protein